MSLEFRNDDARYGYGWRFWQITLWLCLEKKEKLNTITITRRTTYQMWRPQDIYTWIDLLKIHRHQDH